MDRLYSEMRMAEVEVEMGTPEEPVRREKVSLQ